MAGLVPAIHVGPSRGVRYQRDTPERRAIERIHHGGTETSSPETDLRALGACVVILLGHAAVPTWMAGTRPAMTIEEADLHRVNCERSETIQKAARAHSALWIASS